MNLDILQVGFSQMLYIDPAATSVLLSSITAILVALGATFIIVWRKLKKKVSNVLHIDENAGKVVEDELVVKEDETPETESTDVSAKADDTVGQENETEEPKSDSSNDETETNK